ncbi:MAG: alpha/beta hydrolase [Nevskia sp.]|nr:alpha/beta hydrolase [Nevskia sp.]
MAEAHLNGVDIAYQQMGEGPDLVLVHGLAASRAFWFLHYAVPLSRHFRVTLFDLRGHGYSGVPASGYDAPTMAGDLAALLDHLGITSCVLAGHSYGGGVALEYAARHPQRVSRLVIMDTKVNRLQPEQKLSDCPHLSPFEIEVAARSGHDWDNEKQVGLLFLEVLARWRLQGGESTARDAFTPFGEGRGAQRAAKQWLALLDGSGAAAEFVKPGVEAEAIAALPMPLLLLYGEHSRCMPSCRALQQLLPRAELELIPQGGHFFPISHAATVRRRLAQFLDLPWPAAEAATASS